MTLQNKLDALRAQLESQQPPAFVAAVRRAVNELINARVAELALRAGDVIPAFRLLSTQGRFVSSTGLLRKGPTILAFCRGLHCPYCDLDLEALQAALPEFQKRGASLVAISQQTAASSRKSKTYKSLSFPLLVDRGGEVGASFGLRWNLPAYLREAYQANGIDLGAIHGDDGGTFLTPARYVVGRNGVVAYAEVNEDFTMRPEPLELLPALDLLVRAGET